tara:strand:+ start:1432 stop:1608 length:177 start_codon:yes stop_codon:yes gene_type:complete
MTRTRTVDKYYLEITERKASAFYRLLEHYNNHDCVALADFILNDEYFTRNKKEGGEEE